MHTSLTHAIKRVTASPDGSELTAEFIFSKDDPIFAGHFPGRPVIPAVYQVGVCRKIAERFVKSAFTGIAKSRFSRMCVPDAPYEVTISLSRSENSVEAECSIHSPAEKALCSKMVLLFAP
jgi:3-hydroxyacyl-[acyl-carrier-protein] dehydratase